MDNDCLHESVEYIIFPETKNPKHAFTSKDYFKCLDCGQILFDWAKVYETLRLPQVLGTPEERESWEQWQELYKDYLKCVSAKYTYVRCMPEGSKREENSR